MVLSDFALGTILAFATSIAFGTQTSFAKIPSVVANNVRMEVFNIYFMSGVAIICLIGHLVLTLFLNYVITFSFMGIISALLLYFGELFALLSVQQIGVAYGMALSVGSSAITAIVVQICVGQNIAYYSITIIGLIIVTLSVIGCAYLKKILSFINICGYNDTEKINLLLPRQESVFNILSETSPLIMLNNNETSLISDEGGSALGDDNANFTKNSKKMILGFIYASLGGICYCTVPLPSLYVDENSAGIKYSISFGIGCFIVLPLSILNIITINPFHTKNGEQIWNFKQIISKLISFDEELWHKKSACLAGIGGGIVWGIGNLMGICTFLYLDFVIVMVYVQFHIIVSLLWGICLWKEITQKIEMILLSLFSITLIGGMVCVTYGVYGGFSS